MHLQSHLAASWIVGSALEHRRDRRLVAWAGVVPDLDALAVLGGVDAFGRWHHVLTHGLLAAVVTAGAALALATPASSPVRAAPWADSGRLRTALLAFAAFHLHLALDLLGSGVGWRIAYLYPFSSDDVGITWGWALASWQNVLATVAFIGWSLRMAVTARRSFVEAWMPASVDAAFCALVRRTWARVTAASGTP